MRTAPAVNDRQVRTKLMGCQENLGLYLNLSRKELQGLCKKNNLPANRSTTQLAKSLALFLKRKPTCPASLKGYSSDSMALSSSKSGLAGSTPDVTHVLLGQSIGGPFEKTLNSSSESDTSKTSSMNKENRVSDRINLQIQKQLYSSDHMAQENADKGVHVYTSNNESTECFDCSVADNVQHAKVVQQHGCGFHQTIPKNKSQKSLSPRSCGQKLLSHSVINTDNLCSSKRQRLLESSKKDGLASVNDTSTNAAPSFEFFVMSDEGINLYIDLNSGPSDWIRSLKDNVCINQITQHQRLGSVAGNSRVSDVDKHRMAVPSRNTGLSLQTEFDGNSACTNSSLSSVVSQNCMSEIYPDAALASSGSSIMASSCNQVKTSACLEHNQASSCIVYSNTQNQLIFESTSPQVKNILKQDSVSTSFRLEKSNADIDK
ncbi:hypothetical protein AXF42_Ash001391 [Apostasia shenzhenica]|uniref:Uncharacterized protein n=1 Tax=Apostasia shenzhenica TaxID=1088818 RepID=A0A2I0AUS8_9ASPA|nr:hypothetical protein AXF42_Ash001391 [Apostasia shenzhenica]